MRKMDISIPNFDLLYPVSYQHNALMDIDAATKTHAPYQIHQLNEMRLNLKAIFLSVILCEASNVVKACYITGNPYVTRYSS